MKDFSLINIMHYPVFKGNLCDILSFEKPVTINALNAYSYVVAKTDKRFKRALKKSNVLLPDGFPIVLAASFIYKEKINKIAGEDIFLFLCNHLNMEHGKCFFLGSTIKTLDKIGHRLELEYPNIKAHFYSPTFNIKFCRVENERIISEINSFIPNVLFVGMTAPKQEKWVFDLRNQINADIICSVGAVFDFFAETVKRPSRFWVCMNLEWFVRMLKEPKRLWKRYLVYSPIFFFDMLKFKLNKTFIKSHFINTKESG